MPYAAPPLPAGMGVPQPGPGPHPAGAVLPPSGPGARQPRSILVQDSSQGSDPSSPTCGSGSVPTVAGSAAAAVGGAPNQYTAQQQSGVVHGSRDSFSSVQVRKKFVINLRQQR